MVFKTENDIEQDVEMDLSFTQPPYQLSQTNLNCTENLLFLKAEMKGEKFLPIKFDPDWEKAEYQLISKEEFNYLCSYY